MNPLVTRIHGVVDTSGGADVHDDSFGAIGLEVVLMEYESDGRFAGWNGWVKSWDVGGWRINFAVPWLVRKFNAPKLQTEIAAFAMT